MKAVYFNLHLINLISHQIPAAASSDDALNTQLFQACRDGDIASVEALLLAGADPTFAEPVEGITVLMAASETGSVPLIKLLLDAGAPWNAQDKEGYTAGEYATSSGNKEAMPVLLDWAVTSELILSSISKKPERASNSAAAADVDNERTANSKYLGQKLCYSDGCLIDEDGEAVMMGWETPLMKRHADIICANKGDVLNVGFGLGIIDEEIQLRQPRSHTIIEAHPDVYAHMLALGWDTKPGVRIFFGRWQEVIQSLHHEFDGIFFDTYSEYYHDMREFHSALPQLLRPGGGSVYSFFNGLAQDNLFFHLVYGEIARRELNALGFSVKYDPEPIDVSSDATWEGVTNRYWHLPVYFIPTCVLLPLSDKDKEEEEEEEESEAAVVEEVEEKK